MAYVFTLSPHSNFIEELAHYLVSLAAQNPLALAHYSLYLPSRRACLKLTKTLQHAPHSFALPKMYGLNDTETLLLDHGFDTDKIFQKPVITPMLWQHLISRLLKKVYPEWPMPKVLTLSKSIITLLNELSREDVSLEDLKSAEKNNDFSLKNPFYHEHLGLLKQIMAHSSNIIEEWGMITPHTLKKHLYHTLAHYWRSHPHHHFMLAGITQYQKESMLLMKSAVDLPNTTLILPFVDEDIISNHPPENSPFYHTSKIIHALGSISFSPLNKTEAVKREIYPIESSSAFYEAKAIASLVQTSLGEKPQNITIVAPDRSLALQITQELMLLGLDINDSSPLSFAQTPLGQLALLAANVITTETLQDYLACMKHPLVFEDNQKEHLHRIYTFETTVRASPLLSKSMHDYPLPYTEIFLDPTNDFGKRLSTLLERLAPQAEYHDLFSQHMEELTVNDVFYHGLSAYDHLEIFKNSLEYLTVPSPVPLSNTSLNLIGLMEARVEHTEMMIITGMSEGTLPRTPPFDPFLSPALRRTLGLSSSDALIGLQTQDFLISLTGAKKIILSRHKEHQGTEQLPSRFLQHIQHTPLPPPRVAIDTIAPVELPIIMANYLTPPSLSHEEKPKKISVSAFKLLMEDSYGFYAKYCLGLKKLWAFDDPLEALMLGQYLHHALDDFIKKGSTFTPHHTSVLENIALEHFAQIPLTFMQKHRVLRFCQWLCHHSHPVTSQQAEVRLEQILMVQGTPLTLYGIADRIDFYKDCEGNRIAIIDYKTGTPPSQKNVEKGYAPQLPLEAFLVDPSLQQTIDLCYLRSLPKAPFGEALLIKNTPDLLEKTKEGLVSILETYMDDDFYFYPTPNPSHQPDINDYQHLERRVA